MFGLEYMLLMKTKSQLFAKLRKRILALHAHELPEIVSLAIGRGFKPYLGWIDPAIQGCTILLGNMQGILNRPSESCRASD